MSIRYEVDGKTLEIEEWKIYAIQMPSIHLHLIQEAACQYFQSRFLKHNVSPCRDHAQCRIVGFQFEPNQINEPWLRPLITDEQIVALTLLRIQGKL